LSFDFQRSRLIAAEKTCPVDLKEAICTIIWAANRTEVPELSIVRDQMQKKYGKEFVEAAMKNEGGCVNERIVHKLSVQVRSSTLG